MRSGCADSLFQVLTESGALQAANSSSVDECHVQVGESN